MNKRAPTFHPFNFHPQISSMTSSATHSMERTLNADLQDYCAFYTSLNASTVK
jgi:hypothetical protein